MKSKYIHYCLLLLTIMIIPIIGGCSEENLKTVIERPKISNSDLLQELKVHKEKLDFGEYQTFTSNVTNEIELSYNLERNMSKVEVNKVKEGFLDNSYNLIDEKVYYLPYSEEKLKSNVEKIDEVKNMKEQEYGLKSIYLNVKKGNTTFFISIFEGSIEELELEKNFKSEGIVEDSDKVEIESLGDWKLIANQKVKNNGKMYSIAASDIQIKDRTFTTIIQNYDEKNDESLDAYTKLDINNFIKEFNSEKIIEFFY
ncbi:hypothetical protein ACQKM9_19735 [Viridibacillus sp. NPDC093762]|uniref:hypothetical protein n=1 Tax=Viridibacillus sp. NPDC093762 TaxID=3390720 RepID=UPI003D0003BB